MFRTSNGFRPVDVEGVEFHFKVGDVIETIPTGKSRGKISQITYENGEYWYDFTDGSTTYVKIQDKWRLVPQKNKK